MKKYSLGEKCLLLATPAFPVPSMDSSVGHIDLNVRCEKREVRVPSGREFGTE